MERFDVFVPAEWAGQRADRFLADWEELDLSRSALQRLFEQGLIRCGDQAAAKNLRLKAGQHLTVDVPEARPLEAQPHDPDVKALLRIAVVYDIPIANNLATADFMLNSKFMDEPYSRQIENFNKTIQNRVESMSKEA